MSSVALRARHAVAALPARPAGAAQIHVTEVIPVGCSRWIACCSCGWAQAVTVEEDAPWIARMHGGAP